MQFREGERVAYVGPEVDGRRVGDEGQVVSSAGDSQHVVWSTGERQGAFDLVPDHELTPSGTSREAARQHVLDDSLEYGPLLSFSAAKVYEESGGIGLVTALADDGHLANLAGLAEDLLGNLAEQVRGDASVQAALANLDEQDANDLVMLTASVLMREAFGDDDAE